MRLALASSLLVASLAHADYADNGTLTVAVSTGSVSVQGTAFPYDLYAPMTGGPWPVIALGHGFSNSRANMEGLARALSTRGNFVVVPQFPFGDSNHARNGAAMLAAIDAVVAGTFASRIDSTRQGVAGHSAGGLSAMFATLSRPSMKAVVELDGVDGMTPLSSTQLGGVSAAVLLTFGEPSMCNSQNNTAAWYAALAGPRGRFKVTNALHCDPQEPTNALCTFGCPGTADAQRTRRFKRAAVAWLQYFVGCEVAARAAIDGADFQAEKTAGTVGADQFAALPSMPCGSSMPDAGNGGGAGGGGGGAAGGAAGGAGGAGGAAGGSAGGAAGGAAGGSAGGAAGGSAGGSTDVDAGSVGGGAGGGSAGGSAGGAAGGSAGGSAGGGVEPEAPKGCGCNESGGLLTLLALAVARRRRVTLA